MTSDSTSLYFDGVASLFQKDIVEMKYKDLCNSGIIRLLERWLVEFWENECFSAILYVRIWIVQLLQRFVESLFVSQF